MRQFRFEVMLVVVAAIYGCAGESDKANVEEQNRDKFDNLRRKREAQFVVDVVDASYAILEVAQIAEQKSDILTDKGIAKKIIESQTSMMIRMKAYAEANDISIPFSGPARSRNSVKRLHDKTGSDFNQAWRAEVESASESLVNKLERQLDKADTTLRPLLLNSIETLKDQRKMLAEKDDK